MAFGNQNQSGFNNASEVFANIVKLIGPNAIIVGPNFYIDRTGAYFYDQNITIGNIASGAGHLIGSGFVAPFTGAPPVFDRFGNSVLPEFCTYNNTGGSGSLTSLIVAINLSVGDLAVRTAPQYNQTFNNTYTTLELGNNVLGVFNINTTADGNLALTCGLNTDPKNRFQFDDNGFMQWGTGAVNPDTQLGRSGVNQLQTAGAFLFNLLTAGTVLGSRLTVDSFFQWQVDVAGKHQWGPGGASTVDTTLSRTGVGILNTPNNFECDTLNVPVRTSNPHFGVDANGLTYFINAAANASNIQTDSFNALFGQLASGLVGHIGLAVADDFTATTVTGTGNNLMGKVYTLPALDLNVGAKYEFDLQITGTQGTTAQGFNVGFALNGSEVGNCSVPAAFAATSQKFIGKAKLTLHIKTGGTTGSYDWTVELQAGQGGTSTPAQNLGGSETDATINTTVSNTIQFTGGWTATTGAPTFVTQVTGMRKVW